LGLAHFSEDFFEDLPGHPEIKEISKIFEEL